MGGDGRLTPQARRVAHLFQDCALFPHLSVRQNIAFGLTRGPFDPRRTVRHATVDHWLEALGLQGLAYQSSGDPSGGQKQRTALARADCRAQGAPAR